MDKDTLRQYRALLREIDELEREKRRVLDRYLAAPPPSGMPGGGLGGDAVGKVVTQRLRYQELIDTKLDELIALRGQIEAAIEGLPSDARRLIRLRYIEGMSWERVAVELSYSVHWVWHWHGRILQQLAKDDSARQI